MPSLPELPLVKRTVTMAVPASSALGSSRAARGELRGPPVAWRGAEPRGRPVAHRKQAGGRPGGGNGAAASPGAPRGAVRRGAHEHLLPFFLPAADLEVAPARRGAPRPSWVA
jgi:hypothetical protein